MEPTVPKMRIFLGEFQVTGVYGTGAFKVELGKTASITIHLGDFPHKIKPGDKVPLYTEIPYEAFSTSVNTVHKDDGAR